MAKEKVKKENKHFFKDFKAELKKVIWPTPKQVVNNTIAVVTIVLITAAIVLVLDLVFEKMNEFGIDKIKTVISTDANNTTTEDFDQNYIDADDTDQDVIQDTVDAQTEDTTNTIEE